jgi:hypothetical protein
MEFEVYVTWPGPPQTFILALASVLILVVYWAAKWLASIVLGG